ncbi:Putative peptidoglycan binding domain-containing protein [Micrococcales bacterium KH10]|nr:Putative peptidoglycan binding domain-containing protein [Micrococcales bacterium KH10]
MKRQCQRIFAGLVATVVAIAVGVTGVNPAVAVAATSSTDGVNSAVVANSPGDSGAEAKKPGKNSSKKKTAKQKKAAKKKKAAKAKKALRAAKKKARAKSRKAPVLSSGSRGEQVTRLQKLLRKNGYWISSADGKYGHSTQQAVMAVQKSTGRARTGRATQGVWYELFLGTKPPTSITKAQSKKRAVFEIDLSRQIMSIVRNGKVRTTFNISSGSNSYYTHKGRRIYAHTPTGSFKVYMKRDYLHKAELGPMYRPQYYLSGGWAIHGSPNIPNYPASHGCIRIANPAMDYLWGKGGMGIGSEIVIRK